MELVAIDIGGTHTRFAIASVDPDKGIDVAAPVTLKTSDHASFEAAWEAFRATLDRPLPRAAAIAFAGPVDGDILQMTNNHWVIRRAQIRACLHLDRFVVVNDFAAVGHAVAQAKPEQLIHLCGPDIALPESGTICVAGPGTGLGIAHVLRVEGGYHVCPTEGGHMDFAPLDMFEDGLLVALRARYRRVSVERVVSGPGLASIYEALARMEGRAVVPQDDKSLWAAALDGSDSLAVAALDRFCMSLGSVAGDIALAQGAHAVVIAGGLGQRLAPYLIGSGFAQRFTAKGRFETTMAAMPVKLIMMDQPGLFGAAAAFAREYQA
ncbi:MAG: glucokinase [Sphingobium sp.]